MGDISKNFSMCEFVQSNTAKEKKIDNTPNEIIEGNIIKLVINILQPLRDFMGVSCTVNSGYRCPALNKAIGGATNSAHMQGGAVDITFGSKTLNKKAFDWIKKNCKYRQLIWEKGDSTGPQWIHVEFKESDNKMQVLNVK